MRRIGLVPAVAALLTAAFTGVAVLLGPKPTVAAHSGVLNDPSLALAEPTDRVVLIGWWLIAIAMGLVTAWLLRRDRRASAGALHSRLYSCVVAVLGVGSVGLIIASITRNWEERYAWPGITTLQLLVGLAFALFIFRMWEFPKRLAVASTLIVVGLVLGWSLPALLQTPGSIGDPYHFQFTSDEISAVAAGRFPLSDYIPQYSVLLGFPIAPVIHVLGGQAIFGVLGWLLLLQVVALIVAVTLPTLVGGWKMVAPASVVAVFPPLATVPPGGSATAYFAVTPMRIVLPSLTLLAAFLVHRHRSRLTGVHAGRLLSLGVLAGLAGLNNPDYGLPAGLAVLVVSVIASLTMRDRTLSSIILLVGMSVPFVTYAIVGWAIGRPVHWSEWLFFQRTFGAEGTFSVAMRPFGLHIAFVTLFISASVIGFALMVKCRPAHSCFAYRQGLLLALVGGWSLLSLPYFASRSVTPTLVGGYSFMAGMVVAAFLPLLRATLRGLRMSAAPVPLASAIALSLGALAVAGAASTFMLVRFSSAYLDSTASTSLSRFPILDNQTTAIEGILNSPDGSELRLLVGEGRVRQALNMASLTSFAVGIPSGAVVPNPGYYDLSPIITRAQCALPWPDGVDYLLVSERTAIALAKEQSCASHFDLAGARRYTAGDSNFVLLLRAA